MSRYSGASDYKVYVGDLGESTNGGPSASKLELEDAFSYYGTLRSVWVARNPPGFAFVEFEDPRDARRAVRCLDGRSICGRRVRVEMSNGGQAPRRGIHPEDRCYECGDRGHYARDCRRDRARGGRRRERTRSRSHSRAPRSGSSSSSRSHVSENKANEEGEKKD